MVFGSACFVPPKDVSSDPCYLYIHGKDSIIMKLSITGKYVNGRLIYNLYEKDKNIGSITGEMHKDTLIADYVFRSEGIRSIREVAFLVTDSTLIEGYGQMIESSNKMIFKDRKTLSFSGNTILKKGECSDVTFPF
jgi:hypothetical protein